MKKIKRFLITFCFMLIFSSIPVYATDYDDYFSNAQATLSEKDAALATGESYMSTFAAMDEVTAKYYKDNANGFLREAAEVYHGYLENDTLGEYKEITESNVEEEKDGYLVTVTAEFEKAKLTMKLECKHISNQLTPTGLTFSTEDANVKSLGKKLADAGLNTLIGLFTVFLILILISYIISLFKYIPAIQEKMSKKDAAKNAELTAVQNVSAQTEQKEEIEENIQEELAGDSELVAVITAAIIASGASPDGFVVRSIRRSKRV